MIAMHLTKRTRNLLSLLLLTTATTVPALAVGIGATATYTSKADASIAGAYDYSLTLNNTGDTNIGTFWFSWVPGAGFLSAVPTNIASPNGWTFTQTNTGKALRWQTTTNPLQAGQSFSGFNFVSTETPDQFLLNYTGTGAGAGLPVLTSFVYITGTTGSNAQFVPAAATPEPEAILLTLTGLATLVGPLKRRRTP